MPLSRLSVLSLVAAAAVLLGTLGVASLPVDVPDLQDAGEANLGQDSDPVDTDAADEPAAGSGGPQEPPGTGESNLTLQHPAGVVESIPVNFSGRLLTAGERLPGQRVEVRVDGEILGAALTDEEGRYDLQAALHDVGVRDVQAVAYAGTPAEERSRVHQVEVVPHDRVTVDGPRTVAVGATATYDGRVAEGRDGVAGAQVEVEVDGVVQANVTANATGWYEADVTFEEAGAVDLQAVAYRNGSEFARSPVLDVTVTNASAGGTAGDDWPTFRGDRNRTGAAGPAGGGDGSLLWTFAYNSSGDHHTNSRLVVDSSPAVVDGTVYVGYDDNRMYAVDAQNGTKDWSLEAGGDILSSPSVEGGRAFFGALTYLRAVDAADGDVLWKVETGCDTRSSPAIRDGVLYYGDLEAVALNASTGEEIWRHDAGSSIDASPLVRDHVYLGTNTFQDRGGMLALHPGNGTVAWEYPAAGDVVSSAATDGDDVYFGSRNDSVYALDADTGALRWRFNTSGDVDASPALVDGTLYVGSDDDQVYALDADTGALRWSYGTGGDVVASPAVANGTVYAASHDGSVYALDAADGSLEWSYGTGDSILASPTVVDGVAYVSSEDGHLYALDAAG